MDDRAVRTSLFFAVDDDEEPSKRWLGVFVALAFVAALVLLLARTSPAIAASTSGSVLASEGDEDDDDDGDDATDGGDGDDGTDGEAAAAGGDETATDGDTVNNTVTAATVDTAPTADTATTGDTTAGDTTATGENTVGGTTVGDDTVDDTTTGDTTGDGTTVGDTTGLAEFAGLLPDDEVLGLQINRGAAAPKAAADQVLGAGLAAAAPGDTGVLPFTGGQIATVLAAAASLIGAGGLLAKRRRG